MTEHVSKSIWIGKSAYMHLDRESRKQRGGKKLSPEAEERLWKRVTVHSKNGMYRATDNSFGGGDGTYDGRWWAWNVDELKRMLDKAGLKYKSGKEIRYINM